MILGIVIGSTLLSIKSLAIIINESRVVLGRGVIYSGFICADKKGINILPIRIPVIQVITIAFKPLFVTVRLHIIYIFYQNYKLIYHKAGTVMISWGRILTRFYR